MARSESDPSLPRTLASAAGGDQDAWATLVRDWSPRVFALVVAHCRDGELAEEITQATFVKLVSVLDRYDEQGKFEPWLFRIAMNSLRDEMRRRKRHAKHAAGFMTGDDEEGEPWNAIQDQVVSHQPPPPEADDPLARMEHAEQLDRLRRAIATMSEADREVMHLRHTVGLSFPEIAQTLEQPLGTVLARGHRALGKLRKMIVDDQQK